MQKLIYQHCKLCKNPLQSQDNPLYLCYIDIERADGPSSSDPCQIGLVKWDIRKGSITEKLELNILPKNSFIHPMSTRINGLKCIGNILFRGKFCSK